MLTADLERCIWCGHEPRTLAQWLEVLPVVAMSASEIVWRTRPGQCVRCGEPLDELTIGPLARYCTKACRQAASKQRAAAA